MPIGPGRLIPVGVSGRHVHLNSADLKILFGHEAELHVIKELSQTGQFAAKETVLVAGPKGAIPGVRILGPVRRNTQVEVSHTDCFHLGVPAVVRNSGDLPGTPGLVLIGPKGSVTLAQGAMVALRHVHMTPQDAADLGLADMDLIRVGAVGDRALIFDQVLVRVDPTFALELHLDTDEANSAGLSSGDLVAIVPPDLNVPDAFAGIEHELEAARQRDFAH